MASFATEKAKPRQRLHVAMMAAVLIISAVMSGIWANVPLPELHSFLPSYASVILITDLLTAYLLVTQFRLVRQPPVMALASAYFFSGLVVIPHMLMFPGIVTPTGLFGDGSQGAIWMWVFWHGGFPVLILFYTAIEAIYADKPVSRSAVRDWSLAMPVLVLVAIGMLSVLAVSGYMPSLMNGRSFSNLSSSPTGIIVILLNVAALAAVMRITCCRTVGQLGLALAVLASLLDVTLTLYSQSRFSVGWYLARVNSLVSATSVLAVFLYEIAWLYHRLADMNEVLSRQALLDGLTGLSNRRHFDQCLEAEWARALRERHPLALLMIDVDFFKKYNDGYGHLAGDECLRKVGAAIENAIHRPADMAARYGGEEFAVILPKTDADGALRVANIIGQAVRDLGIEHRNGTELGIVTVSLGVASLTPRRNTSSEDLKAQADSALYRAKELGRNRTWVQPPRESAKAV